MISAVLLAAGRSRRFGKEKFSSILGGRRLIDWSVDALIQSAVDQIIVIANEDTARLIQVPTTGGRLSLRVNPAPEEGMSQSIIQGLKACRASAEAAMLVHADMPLVDAKTIDRLLAAWDCEAAKIVAPRFDGRQGNPVTMPRRFWPEVFELSGDVGCKAILQNHLSEITWVEFEDDRILADVDCPDDLIRLQARLKP